MELKDKKFINEVATMTKQAAEVTSDLLKENEDLKAKVSELEANQGEKQAADDAETVVASLTDDAIERAVDHIIQAGKAKEASRDELLKQFAEQPDALVDYVEELAKEAALQPVKRLGKPVAKEASQETSVRESDKFWEQKVLRNRG